MGEDIVDEPKVPAEMVVTADDMTSYDGRIGIEFRGATSQTVFPKKSYGIETWDDDNVDIDASILSMPAEEDWILYGPYSDKTLLRNRLIYTLATNMGNYASRTLFVDLSIDDEDQGLYVWMEKLKRDKERIDISKLNPDENSGEDLTGGYILKIDKTVGSNLGDGYNEQNSFTSVQPPPNASDDQAIRFLYEYPDAEDISTAQKDYISGYVADFEAALASDDFDDISTGYQAYIDVPSFIDFFILNEVSNNIDGYRLSTFMHKDKNDKLKMGPIWDFNLSFGNANYCGGEANDVWAYQFNERCNGDFWLVPFWWERLLEDEAYVAELQDRWRSLRSGILSEAAILQQIDLDVERLLTADAIQRNDEIWSVIGEGVWPNAFVGESYVAEVDYMKDWIRERLIWLDGAIERL
jgi:spore coat protein CotH